VQYTGKWGEALVGYWTLGACDGSNGCYHKQKKEEIGVRGERRARMGCGGVGRCVRCSLSEGGG
jgi:hypothetical protein